MRNLKSAEERQAFDEQMDHIMQFTCEQEPFRCQDIVEALKERDKQFEEKLI